MSDPYTEVVTPSAPAIGLAGHVDFAQAVADARDYWQHERDMANRILNDLDAGRVRVFQQPDPYAVRGRCEVTS